MCLRRSGSLAAKAGFEAGERGARVGGRRADGLCGIMREWLGNVRDAAAQVRVQHLLLRHVGRDLAVDVEIVPGIQDAHFAAAVSQGARDEVDDMLQQARKCMDKAMVPLPFDQVPNRDNEGLTDRQT